MSTYAEMERMTGPDALMLHMERPTVPMHTLKVVVLEPGARGPLSLAELRAAVAPYLGLVAGRPRRSTPPPGWVGGRSGPPTRTSSSTTTSTSTHCPPGPATSSTSSAGGWPSDTSTAPVRCGR